VQSSIYQGIAQKTYKTLNMGRSQSAPKKKCHLNRLSMTSTQPIVQNVSPMLSEREIFLFIEGVEVSFF
jgi:hypothetical protein